MGGLDVLINAGAIILRQPLDEVAMSDIRRMMDVNFMGTFYGARTAIPMFRARGRGHLIIISSIVGQRGIEEMSGYSATKAAQVGFAESLRAEFAGSDIHVSVVYPVSTATEFREAMARDYGHVVSGLGPKQPVDAVAASIVACVRRPRPEVYPHRLSRALTVANAVAPGLTDRIVKRYSRRRTVASG